MGQASRNLTRLWPKAIALVGMLGLVGCKTAEPYPAWVDSNNAYHDGDPPNRPAIFDYVPAPTHWRRDQDKMETYRWAFGHD